MAAEAANAELVALDAPRHGVNAAAMDASKLDQMVKDMAGRLAAVLPENLSALRRDLETNFRSVLQSGLARLNLVTREEFDTQAAVLKRTREKLEALEQQVKELTK
jgi:BMFP domain-containing protein YqiC